ncbi:hypothetical protein GCM10023331_27190 [Algivirga pacifica]|uniref:HEAT repeat domain-containing protein n=2 Tax=Algivirga pacifica TaxID=1162670 RepID=A0ABP9DEJ8_9BACT
MLSELLTQRHTKEQLLAILNEHPEWTEELIDLAVSGRHPEGWRAAWLLGFVADKYRLQQRVGELIATLPDKSDGYQRELLKRIQELTLNEEQEGELFDYAVQIWESIGKIPSVRSMAMNLMLAIIQKYPELKEELTYLLEEEYLSTLSPGIRKGLEKRVGQLLMKNEE